MAAKDTRREQDIRREHIERLRRGGPSVTLPGIGARINVPDRPALAWYVGIGAMAAAELIEWPVALLLTTTHFLEHNARRAAVRELAEGIDAGA